jgi:hypothetical protein
MTVATTSSVLPRAGQGIPFQNGTVVQGRIILALLPLVAVLTGCRDNSAPAPRLLPNAAGTHFDETSAGTVRGRVVWDGPLPVVEPFRAVASPSGINAFGPRRSWPNPNAPSIDPATRGVGDVVVFLRGVDPARARPWDHPPVAVELRDYFLFVRQGDYEGRNGFVRRGDSVEVVSRLPIFQGVQGRGAAFFSLPLPDADRPWRRRLDRAGVVELSSTAGQFWMRGWLHVADHPYFARTAADGSFSLPQVPAGSYELVCCLPNWHVVDHELDADNWQVTRIDFAPAIEVTQPVQVISGGTASTMLVVRSPPSVRSP